MYGDESTITKEDFIKAFKVKNMKPSRVKWIFDTKAIREKCALWEVNEMALKAFKENQENWNL